jgi:hypothetical protein
MKVETLLWVLSNRLVFFDDGIPQAAQIYAYFRLCPGIALQIYRDYRSI